MHLLPWVEPHSTAFWKVDNRLKVALYLCVILITWTFVALSTMAAVKSPPRIFYLNKIYLEKNKVWPLTNKRALQQNCHWKQVIWNADSGVGTSPCKTLRTKTICLDRCFGVKQNLASSFLHSTQTQNILSFWLLCYIPCVQLEVKVRTCRYPITNHNIQLSSKIMPNMI